MSTNADFVLRLIDQVTKPAAGIERTLRRLDAQFNATTGALDRLNIRVGVAAGGMGRLGTEGERAAMRISRAWSTVGSGLRSAQQDMQGLLTKFAAATAATAAVGYAGKSVLDAAGLREMQITQISTLMRTNDKSKVLPFVDWVNKFADETPFTDQQTMKLVRQSMGYGFNTDQTMFMTRIIGDAASLSSNDPEDAAYRASSVIRAIGQMKSKGTLMQQEVNQISEHIPGLSEALDTAFGGGKNRRKLQEAGKISATEAINVILKSWNNRFGGGMETMSQQLLGLASTLKSRPQRIFGMLERMGGLDEPKRLFKNLIDMTDPTKEPGKTLLTNLGRLMTRITKGVFGPLADATQGNRAIEMVDRIGRSIEEGFTWWERNGPRITAEMRGFGEGLKSAYTGAAMLVTPLVKGAAAMDRMMGGDGQGMLGKIIGFGIGAAVIGRVLNFASFGLLGVAFKKLGSMAVARFSAAFTTVARAGGIGAFLSTQMGWFKWMFSSIGALIARIGLPAFLAQAAKLIPVWGWVVTGIMAAGTAVNTLYNRFKPFADLVDNIRSSFGFIFERIGGKSLWDRIMANPGNPIMGAIEHGLYANGQGSRGFDTGNNPALAAASGVASRLGINLNDLIAVMNFESGLSTTARNKKSGATGLIQFLPSTAQELGTSTGQLSRMTFADQMVFVEKYLRQHGVKAGMGLEELYMSVLRGNPATGALWKAGDVRYTQNAGLDTNKDGVITSQEAVQKVRDRAQEDRGRIEQVFNISFAGPVSKQAIADIKASLNPLPGYGAETGRR